MSGTIVDEVGLRELYPSPKQRSVDKEVDHLDAHCRDFIAHAPFVALATTGADGRVDASPKGGPAGFVAVLDDHHLAIPDMSGNNRLDSMRNIVGDGGSEGGEVALLFFVPGVDETMRVNGRASISTDPAVLDAAMLDTSHRPDASLASTRPNVAIVVEVRTAFIHCAKAMRRSGLWHPDTWPDTTDMATPACMLRDHIGLPGTVEDSQEVLDASYAATTWKLAGEQT